MESLFGLQMTTIAAALVAALLLVLLVLAVLGWRNNVMLKLGLRPIPRRRTQSALIVVGLMLATLIITAAFVTGDTLSHTVRSLVLEELGPVDEVVELRSNGGSGSTYFSLARFQDEAEGLEEHPLVDGVVPAVQEDLPVVNLTRRKSMLSLPILGMLPDDQLMVPAEERVDVEGNPLLIESLEGRQIFLNEAAAESLEAKPGDRLELTLGASPRVFAVAGVAAGGRSARAYMDLRQAQALVGERARINLVMISNLGDQSSGARYSQQVTDYARALLSDDHAAQRLFQRLASDPATAIALRQAAVDYDGNTRSDLLTLLAGIESGTFNDEIRSLLADEDLGAEVLSILEAEGWQTESVRRRLESQFGELSEFSVDDVKRDGLDEAELAANAFTTIFVVTGLFGIASGLLLIFLIFVMLAAERKSEMGMTRAIGGQRRHLIQMFVYEGTAYDLVSAVVGVTLGALTGLVIALTLGRAFASTDLAIRPHLTLTSLAVSYSLGMLVTFITVLFSARRVSRLNIVAAVRDIPEPPPRPVPLRERLLDPFLTSFEGLRQLLAGRLGHALRTWLIGIPASLLRLVWAGFRGGPLTFLMGTVAAWGGLSAKSGALLTSGVSFALIGGGLLLHGLLGVLFWHHRQRTERITFTLTGLALTVFWSPPSDAFEAIGITNLKSGPEMLFIAGFMMVVGAVMVVMYNTDLMLRMILKVFGGDRRLAPVLRMAVAYPLANRFRTGLTLGMFGVVVFSVVFMATAFKANQAYFANTETLTGGYELRAQTNLNNPVPNLARSVAAKPQLRDIGYETVASEYSLFAELKQEGGKWQGYRVRAVDESYFDSVGYDITVRAEGYESAEEIWRTVRDRPGYAVIDGYPVPSRTETSIVIGGPEFRLEGVYREDEVMEPIRLRVREPGGTTFEVTIIGVVEPTVFMSYGLITSQSTVDKSLTQSPDPTHYYIQLADGVDPTGAGSSLESAFMEYGLETVDQIQEIEDAQTSQRAIEQLLLGFLTLGLIVGVAALGVISSRAVVERRQQIGVLRALGFQAKMVTGSFMVESSFVALLGISLGAALALIPAYQLIDDISADVPGLTFQVPWGSIALVVGLAYGMALLATYLPARQAARVAPAEALRYE